MLLIQYDKKLTSSFASGNLPSSFLFHISTSFNVTTYGYGVEKEVNIIHFFQFVTKFSHNNILNC